MSSYNSPSTRAFDAVDVGRADFLVDDAPTSPDEARAAPSRKQQLERYANAHAPADVDITVHLSASATTAGATNPHLESAAEALPDGVSMADALDIDADYLITIPSRELPVSPAETPFDSRYVVDYALQHAALLHEMGHILYTDFEVYFDSLATVTDATPHESLIEDIYNSFEDGAIEYQIRAENTKRTAERQKLWNHNLRVQGFDSGTLAWTDGLSLALMDLAVYDTSTLGRLLDPSDTDLVFADATHRSLLIRLLPVIATARDTILPETDPNARIAHIEAFVTDYILPLLPDTSQSSQDDHNCDQSRSGSGDRSGSNGDPNHSDTDGQPDTGAESKAGSPDTPQSETPGESAGKSESADSTGDSTSSNTGAPDDSPNTPSDAPQGTSEDATPTDIDTGDIDPDEVDPGAGDTTPDSEFVPDDTDHAEVVARAAPADNSQSQGDEQAQRPQQSSPQDRSQSPADTDSPDDGAPDNESGNTQGEPQSADRDGVDKQGETPPTQTDTGAAATGTDTDPTDTHGEESSGESSTDSPQGAESADGTSSSDPTDNSQGADSKPGDTTGSSAGDQSEAPVDGQHSLTDFTTTSGSVDGETDSSDTGTNEAEATEGEGNADTEASPDEQAARDTPADMGDSSGRDTAAAESERAAESEEASSDADSSPSETEPAQSDATGGNEPTPDISVPSSDEAFDKEYVDTETSSAPTPNGDSSGAPESNADSVPPGLGDELEKLNRATSTLTDDDDDGDSTDEANSQQSGHEGAPVMLDQETLPVLPSENSSAATTDRWRTAVDNADRTGALMKKALPNSAPDEPIRGMTSGRFDSTRASAYASGRMTAFTQRFNEGDREYVLMIVLDRSRSMRDTVPNNLTAAEAAETAVAQFGLAAEDIGIDTSIIDFYNGELRVASPFSVPIEDTPDSLITGENKGGTPLAEAVTFCQERVRQEATNNIIPLLLVVTDGKPNDAERYFNALSEAKEVIPTVMGLALDDGRRSQRLTDASLSDDEVFDVQQTISQSDATTDRIANALDDLVVDAIDATTR